MNGTVGFVCLVGKRVKNVSLRAFHKIQNWTWWPFFLV